MDPGRPLNANPDLESLPTAPSLLAVVSRCGGGGGGGGHCVCGSTVSGGTGTGTASTATTGWPSRSRWGWTEAASGSLPADIAPLHHVVALSKVTATSTVTATPTTIGMNVQNDRSLQKWTPSAVEREGQCPTDCAEHRVPAHSHSHSVPTPNVDSVPTTKDLVPFGDVDAAARPQIDLLQNRNRGPSASTLPLSALNPLPFTLDALNPTTPNTEYSTPYSVQNHMEQRRRHHLTPSTRETPSASASTYRCPSTSNRTTTTTKQTNECQCQRNALCSLCATMPKHTESPPLPPTLFTLCSMQCVVECIECTFTLSICTKMFDDEAKGQ